MFWTPAIVEAAEDFATQIRAEVCYGHDWPEIHIWGDDGALWTAIIRGRDTIDLECRFPPARLPAFAALAGGWGGGIGVTRGSNGYWSI